MLTQNEIAMIGELESKLIRYNRKNARKNRLYYQEDRVKDLGISTPAALKNLDIQLDWCTSAVDVPLERINFRGFYSVDESSTVAWLNKIYAENDFDMTQKGHLKDSMITGASFITIVPGDVEDGEPEIIWANENSSTFTAKYNPRNRKVEYAFKLIKGEYQKGGKVTDFGTLYTKNSIIQVRRDSKNSGWYELTSERNDHDLGIVPVVPIFNDADTAFPHGQSQITPTIETNQDSAKRTLLDSEVAREYFTKPLRSLAGANPDDVLRIMMNGGNISVETSAGTVTVLPGFIDPEGKWQIPSFQELTGGNPAEVIKMIEPQGRIVARSIGVTPAYMGFDTINPSSADAIVAAETKLLKMVNAKVAYYKQVYKRLAVITAAVGGVELSSDELLAMDSVFSRTDITTPSASADRVSKLAAVGINDRILPEWMYLELGLSETEIKQQKKIVLENQAQNAILALSQNVSQNNQVA